MSTEMIGFMIIMEEFFNGTITIFITMEILQPVSIGYGIWSTLIS